MPAAVLTLRPVRNAAGAPVLAAGRLLQLLVAAPAFLLLLALTAMLFRPPELDCYSLDRIAFVVLVIAFLLWAFIRREPLRLQRTAVWPLAILLAMSVVSLFRQPYETKAWSVLAAKFLVPYFLFHVARITMCDESSRRRFEIFALIVLSYLTFIAIAFLAGFPELVYPRFILDSSLSIHVTRARGPFLQAVANGVTLNMLGLLALDSFRRNRLRGALGALLLLSLPVAILATKTRAIWLTFLGSTLALLFLSSSRRIRRCCLALGAAAAVVLFVVLCSLNLKSTLQDRLEDRSPVEIRLAVYHAAWDMFLERPLLGWGVSRMPSQLETRVSDFHLQQFVVHNTYLEVLVEHGLVGLGLYAWLLVNLFRLARRDPLAPLDGTFLDRGFRELWPVLLAVYFVNAFFVVMNYQFVNGLLYAIAGMLAARPQFRGEDVVAR